MFLIAYINSRVQKISNLNPADILIQTLTAPSDDILYKLTLDYNVLLRNIFSKVLLR